MKDEKGSKIMVTNYDWCTTRDVGNMTITGKTRSMIRKGGLLHTQFYGMNKLQFDAFKRFLWDDNDDAMATMILDNEYREALRMILGLKKTALKRCRESYNHSGRRFILGSRLNEGRSWGAREEYRISLTLLQAINSELRCRGNPELSTEKGSNTVLCPSHKIGQ